MQPEPCVRFDDLLEGRLLRRYKRFLADVTLPGGEVVTAHCPNTGAMTGCAEPGSRVWLSRSALGSRKYPHTWELVETPAGVVCVHSALANKVVHAGFVTGRIPGFDAYPEIRREVRYGQGSRADLLLAGDAGRALVEVKAVTLYRGGGLGSFPDAVSARGRKHLHELLAARDQATRAIMFFCVFHDGIHHVSAAGDIDPAYRQALAEALAGGVEVIAWRAAISPAGIGLEEPAPFFLDAPGTGDGSGR
ncbi:MAG: DNA/RNA nuclease SfsA [Halioglobus sp.]|nr:DNA/RNA nuclease SfsA [Halioglobus sp.]